jgi:hypothetical protein
MVKHSYQRTNANKRAAKYYLRKSHSQNIYTFPPLKAASVGKYVSS